MECVELRYAQGHEWKAEPPQWRPGSAGGRQVGAGDEGPACSEPPPDAPDESFMKEMDEINYWLHTKRAPCLMNYDNLIKKQYEAEQNAKLSIEKNLKNGVPSPKKKKRKFSLLEEDCVSVEKQQNLFFEPSQQKQHVAPSSYKSETLESDIDFNIKNSSIQKKPKRSKKQRGNRTVHKKNKVLTTPPLRRSQRRIQNISNNTNLNISHDTYNCTYMNTSANQSNSKLINKVGQKSKKSRTPIALGTSLVKKNSLINNKLQPDTPLKEQFEDLSDVSGFTANYIRSTKLHSIAKPHRRLRSKSNRNLVKESQTNVEMKVPSRTRMLVCVNKSVNTTNNLPNTSMLNCSTDSSQNVINLVTTKINDKDARVNKSTSLLKFVDVRISKPRESRSCEKNDSKNMSPDNVNISFQSRSTTGNSRYPKRQKKNAELLPWATSTPTKQVLDKRRKVSKVSNLNESERKENTDDATALRTRSGRSLTLALRQPENSLLVYSNSTEKVSTVNALNVGGPPAVRERSGFAACFSDSDDDSDALKQRKFFC